MSSEKSETWPQNLGQIIIFFILIAILALPLAYVAPPPANGKIVGTPLAYTGQDEYWQLREHDQRLYLDLPMPLVDSWHMSCNSSFRHPDIEERYLGSFAFDLEPGNRRYWLPRDIPYGSHHGGMYIFDCSIEAGDDYVGELIASDDIKFGSRIKIDCLGPRGCLQPPIGDVNQERVEKLFESADDPIIT